MRADGAANRGEEKEVRRKLPRIKGAIGVSVI